MQSTERRYDPKPINEAMETLGLTNEKVGVAADLAGRTVSAVRSGAENVQLDTLFKVAEVLDLVVEIRFKKKAANA